MSRMRFLTVLVIAGMVAACSSSGGGDGGNEIDATLSEWNFDLASSTGSAGEITFNIQNDGEKTHEFVVIATDLDADALPVDEAADEVDESEFTPVDEVEDVTSGSSATLTVDLEAGHYVILCNLTGHYAKGMAADFTVE